MSKNREIRMSACHGIGCKGQEVPLSPPESKQAPSKPERKPIAVVYLRRANSESAGCSVRRQQTAESQAFIAAQANGTLNTTFEDEVYTALSGQPRSAFEQIMQLCRQGESDVLVTPSAARSSRSPAKGFAQLRELQDLSVSVVFRRERLHAMGFPQIKII